MTHNYETHRTTTVTVNRAHGRPPKVKPAMGVLEILSDPKAGMVLVDACIPLALAARFIATAEAAGVMIRYPE